MSKKKILYLMHVPWGWIKQRPHFIAEGLNQKYQVQVVFNKNYKMSSVSNDTTVDIVGLFKLPFGRFKLISRLNYIIARVQLSLKVKDVDFLWFTSPYFVEYFPKKTLNSKTIIYDCMDDVMEFPAVKTNKRIHDELKHNEALLFKQSDIIISSSDYLKNKLIKRYYTKEITVVNNAIKDISQIDRKKNCNSSFEMLEKASSLKIVYIGTISSWFDFSMLKDCVEAVPSAEFFLFGPCEITIPPIDRVNYCGLIEHDAVFQVMGSSDILIMPFIVNELIRSVNPVKLYEYIYSGKPCIAPIYEETKKFEDYVYLYNNSKDCISILQGLVKKKVAKKSQAESIQFCKNNTWGSRIDAILKILSSN